ncbi:uncharacterized protein TRIADDRAFT_62383 [Trichoplax adhaerens]|uniref:Amino acid transporter transmembrane domain-containing protein n=1 Tax=Trichoplax adhaerens TaxID=10228 RepID=B3SDM6_TRIAD|nr:hypothetical protein TRIADDRAFT_62383 [Trichoplax adhaerens]EDV19162.1 hypothetical protein TRIADDRAFT_62383 [Trichoplax adhaerens]|eukprot:XP_002118340.1 hypothetical protein TRIADDRAFT_62383 [Trichoplax adhaerens]
MESNRSDDTSQSIPEVKITASNSWLTSIWRNFLDFSNMFKAFIGTNYMGLPFGIAQSGLGPGLAIMIIVAVITDHCCHLIVDCKKIVVDRLVTRRIIKSNNDTNYQNTTEIVSEQSVREEVETKLTYGDIGLEAMGVWGLRLVNIALLISQFGFCINYIIFLGNTLGTIFPIEANYTNTSVYYLQIEDRNTSNKSLLIHNLPSGQSTQPAFVFLALIPLPLLILTSYSRNIRQLGFSSVVANSSLMVGFIMVLVFILRDFKVHSGIKWVNWATSFVFFGQMTGAYEGIGTIIPIESSMKGNRHRFGLMLHLAIGFMTLWFIALGILGYLRYGNDVNQIILESLPRNNVIYKIVTIFLCVGVVFTFPLQVFVPIEILEDPTCKFFNKLWRKCVYTSSTHHDTISDPSQPLLRGDLGSSSPTAINNTSLLCRNGNSVKELFLRMTMFTSQALLGP